MQKTWPGFLPPVIAFALTMAALGLYSLAGAQAARSDALVGLLALIMIPLPLVVAVAWGAAVLTARPHRTALMAAAAWGVAAWLVFGGPETLAMVGNVAAGLAAGWVLGARWRYDAALAAIILALAPLAVWTVVQMPLDEQLALVRSEMLDVFQSELPASADKDQRELALGKMEERLEQVAAVAGRIYPAVLVVGLLVEAMVILVLTWLAVRMMGWRLPRWRPPPFAAWTVPFYLVWVLVVGIGLMITRRPLPADIGLNLALLAATLLSIQGIAVQFWVTARMFSPLGRVVFWTVMGVFFVPLVLASGVLLGLADQWLDLRRLGRGSSDGGGDDDAPAADADEFGDGSP